MENREFVLGLVYQGLFGRPGGDCPKSQTFLSENRESAFGLVYGYGVFLSREDFSDGLGETVRKVADGYILGKYK